MILSFSSRYFKTTENFCKYLGTTLKSDRIVSFLKASIGIFKAFIE